MEVKETIVINMAELKQEFDKTKAKVIEAEQFIIKGKEHLVSLSGEYQGLEKLKNTLFPEEKVEKPQG